MQIRGQTLLLSRLKAGLRHGDSVQYSAIWTTTGYEVNKKGTRTLLPIVLEVSTLHNSLEMCNQGHVVASES